MPPDAAVLLLGHGSHVDEGSSRPIHDAAARLRRSSPHREVRVAFWKEEPSLRHAFLLVESPRVVAVPMFTSEGYFTDLVLPRELGVTPPLSRVDRVQVRYTRPVGTHPSMASVVLERARGRLSQVSGDPETTLVILGHGTERHRASGDVVRDLTERLGGTSGFASVRCAFLDEEPRVVPALEGVATPRAVVVPFFIAEGWHVGQTIPRDLGLEGGRAVLGGTEVLYTDPVGTHPAIDRVVEQLVAEAESEGWPASEGSSDRAAGHASEAAAARAAFIAWIDEGGPAGRVFLETRVRLLEPGRYEIRHVADAGKGPNELRRHSDPADALAITRWTESGVYRPLRTAPDLRSGWILEDLTADDLWEAYAALYPVAPVHWYLERVGRLPTTPFRAAAARQTGIYAPVKALTDEQVEVVTASRCGPEGCLRRVAWPVSEGVPSAPGSESVEETVPCPEPCSLFFTEAREVVGEDGG
jgi:sirohydrochlorin cobaltochelatase